MAFDPATIASAIAALSVSGVTIKSLSNIPPALQQRDCPVIYPQYEFIRSASDTVSSLGLAGAAMHQYRYTLGYYYAHAPIGAGRFQPEFTAAIVTNVKAFVDALRAIDTTSGALYVTLSDLTAPAIVADPANNQFYGAALALAVWERQQG